MKCPKCQAELTLVQKAGAPTPENGGVLYVAEDCHTCQECFDPNISRWRCSECECTVYISFPRRKTEHRRDWILPSPE